MMSEARLISTTAEDFTVVPNVHKNVKCPVCHVRGTKRHLCTVRNYQVAVCNYCDADFVYPMPTEAELEAYYSNSQYFEGGATGGYENYDLQTENVLKSFSTLLDRFSTGKGLTILDVGCAYGTQLDMAAKRGWKCLGVEISEHARSMAAQRLGPNATIVKDVNDLPSNQKVDLIVMLDVLEHLPDPYKLFAKLFAKGLVNENTTVAITTPNARSLDAIKHPSEWAYRHPPSHLIYYSEFSLQYLLEKVWFTNVEISGVYPFAGDMISELSASSCAGLLALATGMARQDKSLDTWRNDEELLASQVHKLRHELRASLDCILRLDSERARSIDALNHALKEANDALENARAEFFRNEAELQAIYRTKWFRLRETLIHQPWGFSKAARLAYLAASIATPSFIRRRFSPLAARLRARYISGQAASPSDLNDSNAYLVRQAVPATSRRPRVVHVIANFMLGGSSRLVVDLIENLGAHYEQSVVTGFIPTPPAYVGLDIAELRFAESIRPFIDHFSKAKPDFIHVHYWGDTDESWYVRAIVAAEQLGIPIIENVNTPVAPFKSRLVKRYIYVSDYVRNVFGENHPSHVTVYPGSDFSHFERSSDERIPNDCIGMVYRMERDKLNEDAIVPFIRAVQKRPQTRALIVGGGSLLKPFRRAVEQAGLGNNFEFTGYVNYDELPNFYRRMSVFVAPVWKESFGQVSSFAMNMRVPVVGYDVGAIGEIVRNQDLLAKPGNAEMLSDLIVRLLDSPAEREKIGAAQRQRVQQHFSVQAMIKAYEAIYEEVLTERIAA